MTQSHRRPSLPSALLLLLAAALPLAAGHGAETKGDAQPAAVAGQVTVPQAVADALRAADNDDPAVTLKALTAYAGPDHALIHLALAQAHHRLVTADKPKAGAPAAADEHRAGATAQYRAALALDGTLRNAHLGLAQLASDGEKWADAVAELAQAVDLGTATAGELLFYAQVAVQAKDDRLADVLVERGIVRFPAESGFRRLELGLLIRAQRAEEAHAAVLDLLARDPSATDAWRQLAWAARETGRTQEALAATELASLSKPGDRALLRQLAELQLVNGMPQAALVSFKTLLGDTPSAVDLGDARLITYAARAAADGGDLARGRAWLALVPLDKRTRDQRLLAARLAVQAGDSAAAGGALGELIALGENDAGVLTWAGQLAEQGGDAAKAEALYTQAQVGEGANASAATLRLTALLVKQERFDDAATTLATHLAKHPEDQQARAFQAHLAARVKTSK